MSAGRLIPDSNMVLKAGGVTYFAGFSFPLDRNGCWASSSFKT
jgi:hypothetical protein